MRVGARVVRAAFGNPIWLGKSSAFPGAKSPVPFVVRRAPLPTMAFVMEVAAAVVAADTAPHSPFPRKESNGASRSTLC